MIWITSDWHLGHDQKFIWEYRGFDSVSQMNETIIYNHNQLVRPDDDVYVLGDLVLGPAANINMIARFNGKLHLVRGNHDTDFRWNAYSFLPNVIEEQNAIYLKYEKFHFYLSHFPSLTGNIKKEYLAQMTLNLHGHTHLCDKFYEDKFYCYHCGVDAHDCKPILLDDIIQDMLKHKKQTDEKEKIPLPDPKTVIADQYLFKRTNCDNCVWSYGYGCPGPSSVFPTKCPDGHTYRRDPPDGGYYG